ncbi:MAG: hypothetical protein ACE5G1_00135 [bacterium]
MQSTLIFAAGMRPTHSFLEIDIDLMISFSFIALLRYYAFN